MLAMGVRALVHDSRQDFDNAKWTWVPHEEDREGFANSNGEKSASRDGSRHPTPAALPLHHAPVLRRPASLGELCVQLASPCVPPSTKYETAIVAQTRVGGQSLALHLTSRCNGKISLEYETSFMLAFLHKSCNLSKDWSKCPFLPSSSTLSEMGEKA